MEDQTKQIIGSTEYVDIEDTYLKIPAKIDTGADSSAIWVSDIAVDEAGILTFKLFDKESPFYTGETISRTDYRAVLVRSSNGQESVRYRVTLRVKVAGKTISAAFTLTDRNRNNFPILIGRRTILNKFLVDVSKFNVPRPEKNPKLKPLTQELNEDPYKFHQKYQLGKEN